MSLLDIIVGSTIGQRVIVVGTLGVYLWLAFRRPATARECATEGLHRFAQLFTLIVAALFLAHAIGVLIPRDAVRTLLGEAAGSQGVVLAGFVGGVIPGGPYAAYPIIEGIGEQGAPLAAVVTMLVGYGAIGLVRAPFDLVFFEWRTIGIRMVVGVASTLVAALVAVAVL